MTARILRAQLKDMADFDAAADLQRALAVRTRIAGDDVTEVGDERGLRQVTAPVDVAIMLPVHVGAAGEIVRGCRGAVDDDRERRRVLDIQRTERAKARLKNGAHLLFQSLAAAAPAARALCRFNFIQL